MHKKGSLAKCGTLGGKEVAGLGQQRGAPLPRVQQHLQQQGVACLAPSGSLLGAVLLGRWHVLQLYGKDTQGCCVVTHLLAKTEQKSLHAQA